MNFNRLSDEYDQAVDVIIHHKHPTVLNIVVTTKTVLMSRAPALYTMAVPKLILNLSDRMTASASPIDADFHALITNHVANRTRFYY